MQKDGQDSSAIFADISAAEELNADQATNDTESFNDTGRRGRRG